MLHSTDGWIITYERAVQVVADFVQEFVREVSSSDGRSHHNRLLTRAQAEHTDAAPVGKLRFGPGSGDLDNIVLLGLRRISPTSFEPELAVLSRIQPTA